MFSSHLLRMPVLQCMWIVFAARMIIIGSCCMLRPSTNGIEPRVRLKHWPSPFAKQQIILGVMKFPAQKECCRNDWITMNESVDTHRDAAFYD